MEPSEGASDNPETASLGTFEDALRAGAESTGMAPGTRIGPYVLLSVLGEGGFGMVYLAERREPMVQRVALKIIKPGMDSRAVVARFGAERQALAVMDHPNVAKVFDGGVTSPELGSRPYFVMEHVQGEPITAYCDRHTLTNRERLELFIPVCEAVQHAHHKGIIHRDLKPSNILVTIRDGRGIPKVIDFGVAKAVGQDRGAGRSIFTEMGAIIGTPEYMSPEQAEMGALDIDTRTDVYSLGVVLYELLTGTLPFDTAALRAAGSSEIQRIIREQEPPRPSTRFMADSPESRERAVRRQSQVELLARELRRELEWIPLKAIRKDRMRRYDTPLEIARDIQRYLDGRALLAAPESASYKLRKFIRRNRVPVVATGLVLLVLGGSLVATIVALQSAKRDRDAKVLAFTAEKASKLDAIKNKDRALRQAMRAEEQARRARQERLKSEKVDEFLTALVARATRPSMPSPGTPALPAPARDLRETLERATARIEAGELRGSPAAEARLRIIIGRFWAETALDPAEAPRALATAEGIFTKAAKLAHDEGDGPGEADALEALADVVQARGELPRAEEYLAVAARVRRDICPPPQAPAAGSGATPGNASLPSNDAKRRNIIASLSKSAGVNLRDQFEQRGKTPAEDDRFLSMGNLETAPRFAAEGNYDKAIELQREALNIERNRHGEHPMVVDILRTLARYLRERGVGNEPEVAALEAEADEVARIIRTRRLALAETLDRYSRVLGLVGKEEAASGARLEAVGACDTVLAECARLPGKPGVETGLANLRRALLLLEEKRIAEAEPSLIASANILDESGPAPRGSREALSRLSTALDGRGQSADAARCRAFAESLAKDAR